MSITSLSSSLDEQALAACALDEHLNGLQIPHAFIGGFVLSLLGSERRTTINVVLDYPANEIRKFHQQLCLLDRRFVQTDSKLYFTRDSYGNSPQATNLVRTGKGAIPIETHIIGAKLGLPTRIEPLHYIQMNHPKHTIPILHPSVLILTKLSQWFTSNLNPTYRNPQNICDCNDISFLVYWLASREWKISSGFPEICREAMLRYLEHYIAAVAEDAILIETLRGVMDLKDWRAIINQRQDNSQ